MSLLRRLDQRVNVERLLLVLLVLFTLAIRLKTLEPMELGGDATEKLTFVRKLVAGMPSTSWHWSHHTARWGVNLPAILCYWAFGPQVAVYYLPALLASVVQTVCVFRIGVRLHSATLGLLAAASLVLFPQMIRNGCQLIPGVFAGAYALCATLYLLKYCQTGSRGSLGVAVAGLFGAYLSWLPTLSFLPAFLLIIWFAHRRWRDVAVFCGILCALIAIETVLYALWTDNLLGRLSIISAQHLKSERLAPLPSGWALFDRYTELRGIWPLTLGAYVLATVGVLAMVRRVRIELSAVTLAGLWFFLGLTFAVKGLDPVTPAITINRPRYLTTGLPFALLTIWGFLFAATRARHRLTHARHGVLYGLGLCGLLWLAYGSRFSGWSQHPLAIAAREQRAFNAAFAAGEPIVLRDKSREPLQAALALYWDPGAFGNRYRDFPRVKRLPGGGERRYFVEDPSHGIDADRVRRAIQTGEPILWLSRRIVSDDIRPFDKRGVLVVERVE